MEIKIIDRLISKNASWDDLYIELSTNKKLTQKFKGDVFERLTQAYLLTMPEYKSILSNVWLNQEVPRNVLKKLNLPAEDFGVDLIARTNRNEYWTIQCKFKSTTSSLTYKELATFSTLSFVNAKNISLGIVSHSSNKPIRNRKFLGNISEIGLDRWLNLNDEEWKNIRKFCRNKSVKLFKRKPRPHQKAAIISSQEHFLDDKNSRGKLIMPCATGKSLTAFWIAQSLNAKKIIVAVPSLNLIKQSLNDWTKEYLALGIMPEWLCICSDESVGKVEIDEFATEAYDLGIPTTTDKSEIAKFIKIKTKNPKVIFVTYQSSSKLASVAKKNNFIFDLAILDEAHKTAGLISTSFSTLIHDEKISIKKRLFMTATERVFHSNSDEIISMSNQKYYGTTFFDMKFKDAIDQGIISDYKIITLLTSNKQILESIENNQILNVKGTDINSTESNYLAAGVGLKNTFNTKKIKHTISFHSSIKQAKFFTELFDKLNEIKEIGPKTENFHISSKLNSGKRSQLIKSFVESNKSLLTNARCLTEGIDVPAIDCVLFADPKQSIIDIVQASGRALRKYPKKDYGYILLPIVIPEDISFEEYSETSAFKKVIKIITALSSQDKRISEELKLIEQGKRSKGKVIEINSNLLKGLDIDKGLLSSSISTEIWAKVSKMHPMPYEDAKRFTQKLNLKNSLEWRKLSFSGQFPKDMPKSPSDTYKFDGWISWGDFLGTGFEATQHRSYVTYEEARKIAKEENITKRVQWENLVKSKKYDSLPLYPPNAYRSIWKSFPHFLGTHKEYLPYEDALNYAHSLNLKSSVEWYEIDHPENIPIHPQTVYKQKFVSWAEFLNNRNFGPKVQWAPYEVVRKYAISKKITSNKKWTELSKEPNFPKNFPMSPHYAYKNEGWVSWMHFLGKDRERNWLRFEEIRREIRKKNFKYSSDWYKYTKSNSFPKNYPVHPNRVYRKEWKGWSDFLGSKRAIKVKKYKSIDEVMKIVKKYKISSQKEWGEFAKSDKRPVDVPSDVRNAYQDKGWINWAHFLGRKRIGIYIDFTEARALAHNLNFKTTGDWYRYTKSKKFPDDMPINPQTAYKNDWKGWDDFLGSVTKWSRNIEFRKFNDARRFARKLNLKKSADWHIYAKTDERPIDIPIAPAGYYKDKGWINWADFLGY